MEGAGEGQRRPAPIECLDLVRGALGARLRPRLPRSERSSRAAVKLMYLGALVELATAITVQATLGEVRRTSCGDTPASPRPNGMLCSAANSNRSSSRRASGCSSGSGSPGPTAAGSAGEDRLRALLRPQRLRPDQRAGQGSPVYAPVDLALGITLCLVQLAAVGLIFQRELRSLALRCGVPEPEWRARRRPQFLGRAGGRTFARIRLSEPSRPNGPVRQAGRGRRAVADHLLDRPRGVDQHRHAAVAGPAWCHCTNPVPTRTASPARPAVSASGRPSSATRRPWRSRRRRQTGDQRDSGDRRDVGRRDRTSM